MSTRRLVKRLVALFERGRLDTELDDEIRAHLELAERDARAAGLSPEEARTAARRRFGGIEQMKEQHRDTRSARWLEALLSDVRYGAAALARDRGFTAVVVAVLALGIGANAAVFGVLDAVMLQPLPFKTPDRIVRVWEAPRPGVTNSTTTLDFLDWRGTAASFETLAAEQRVSAALTGSGDAVRLSGVAVTAGYFDVFGVRPLVGRAFRPEDERLGAARVVILSNAAWQTHFGGDAGALHRRIVLDGEPHEVIGVLAAGPFDRDAEFWRPLVFTPELTNRERHWLNVSGRLRPGVTVAQARQEMQALHVVADLPAASRSESTIEVEPLESLVVGESLSRSILVASGAVALVLLIACANVANLLLARGAARSWEMAIRSALGAGRGRLIAQLLTETLLLCVLGAAAGALLAWGLVRVAAPQLADALPPTARVAIDGRVLGFTALAAFGVALVVGLLPAVHASIGNVATLLNQAGRASSARRGRLRRAIVVSEVALSVVLLCGAVLLLVTLANLRRLDTGVRVERIVTMSLDLPRQAYATPERATVFYDALVERLEATPGVVRAALATALPLRWIGNGEGLRLPGEPWIKVRFKRVDPGYFDVLGIPLIAGRGIGLRDRSGAPTAVVVNEALARRVVDAARIGHPVGQQVQLTSVDYAGQPALLDGEIVGVIRSERVGDPWKPDPPVAYVPLAQAPNPDVALLIHTRGDTMPMPAIHDAVRAVDPNVPLGEVATMEQVRDRTFLPASRPAWVIGGFALLAALLAAFGVYGVLAYSVTEQRREIGIRLAMGAASHTIVRHVVRSAAVMIAVGLAFGLAGAVGLTRVMRGLLYEVSPLDPRALAAAAAVMTVIGLTAALVPARRASRVDPARVLRED